MIIYKREGDIFTSPSVRRAWIEMTSRNTFTPRALVALREEGVD